MSANPQQLPFDTRADERSNGAALGVVLLFLSLILGLPGGLIAVGESPQNPRVLTLGAAPVQVSLATDQEVWFRVTFVPTTGSSHMNISTSGSVDTVLAAFVDLGEAQADAPFAEDDDSGAGLNADLEVPLGFPSPYLLRVSAFGFDSGSFQLQARRFFIASDRCDWPAGCPLAVAAASQPSAGEALRLLRRVESEVLTGTDNGRQLSSLYWEIATDLIPDFLFDASLRREVYRRVTDLLPLAEAAVAATDGSGGDLIFSSRHHTELRELLDLVLPHLSPQNRGEIEELWSELQLERVIGAPLSDALAEVGLLPAGGKPVTVLVKLSQEPRFVEKSGSSELSTGDPALDLFLQRSAAGPIERLHSDSPDHRAAGLSRTIVVRAASLAAAHQLMARLQGDPAVEWAERSAVFEILATGRDPFRDDLWGLDAIRAPAAWNTSTGRCSTRVAVVDTGLRASIGDLVGRDLRQLGYDTVDEDSEPEDGHGHGTHVSGIVASALDNATSVAGVAPDSCVFGVRVLDDEGSGTSEDVAEGIVHAVDAGADVINLSLGCDCDPQQAIDDALDYAAARDVVVVAATGNDGVEALFYPASSPLTIAVGAVDSDLALADFSNYGTGLDLVAPGVDVVSLFRDGESCTGSGTSMAAPHVAGVAALVRARNGELDREEVRDLLRQQARDLGAPGYDTRYGAGLVDAAAAVAAVPGGPSGEACRLDPDALCLRDDRFKVEMFWTRPNGTSGKGKGVQLTPDTGYFWFFNQQNVEAVVKVINACSAQRSRFWVFAGGLTNVEVLTVVTDTVTGQVREYRNPQRTPFQPIQDTDAFSTCSAARSAMGGGELTPDGPDPLAAADQLDQLLAALPGSQAEASGLPAEQAGVGGANPVSRPRFDKRCGSDTPTRMCLGGRFEVEATWRRPGGVTGSAHTVALTDDTGYLWFFNENNVEAVVKVIDACGTSLNRFWVFAGGLTNVAVTLTVTDTDTGQVAVYRNPQRTPFQPIQDTNAFATCP